MAKSLLDYAYDYVSGQSQQSKFEDIWAYCVKEAGLSKEEADAKVSRFYTNLMLDGRFVTLPEDEIDLPGNAPFGSAHPVIGRRRAVPDKLVADPESWLIFIPFDTCEFRLGNSILCQALGQNGDNAPEIGDGDYFIDCFELVCPLSWWVRQ